MYFLLFVSHVLLFKFFFNLFYVSERFVCMDVCALHACSATWRPEGIRSPRTGVTDVVGLHGVLGTETGPLEEQSMPLTTGPPL